jgi:hypothetical protein
MSNENQLPLVEETPQIRVQSVVIPENWKKNQEQKGLGFLNWMAYHIKSEKYINDQEMSDALLRLN